MTKAEQIREELETLRDEAGLIHAERVVEWAREHADSALHSQFEWDDTKAAEEYRIWQARKTIAIHIVTQEGERRFISLSIDRADGGGYRDVEDVMRQRELRDVALHDALMELRRVRARYQHLKELAAVWSAVRHVEEQHAPQVAA